MVVRAGWRRVLVGGAVLWLVVAVALWHWGTSTGTGTVLSLLGRGQGTCTLAVLSPGLGVAAGSRLRLYLGNRRGTSKVWRGKWAGIKRSGFRAKNEPASQPGQPRVNGLLSTKVPSRLAAHCELQAGYGSWDVGWTKGRLG